MYWLSWNLEDSASGNPQDLSRSIRVLLYFLVKSRYTASCTAIIKGEMSCVVYLSRNRQDIQFVSCFWGLLRRVKQKAKSPRHEKKGMIRIMHNSTNVKKEVKIGTLWIMTSYRFTRRYTKPLWLRRYSVHNMANKYVTETELSCKIFQVCKDLTNNMTHLNFKKLAFTSPC